MSLIASILTLTNLCGSVSVDTFGGRVVSYAPADGEEVLAGERDAALALMKQLAAGAVTPTSLPDIAEDLGLPLLPRV